MPLHKQPTKSDWIPNGVDLVDLFGTESQPEVTKRKVESASPLSNTRNVLEPRVFSLIALQHYSLAPPEDPGPRTVKGSHASFGSQTSGSRRSRGLRESRYSVQTRQCLCNELL